ncbi:MAG: hypothetical protein WA786_01310 [Acidimicrobiales bacterium]
MGAFLGGVFAAVLAAATILAGVFFSGVLVTFFAFGGIVNSLT